MAARIVRLGWLSLVAVMISSGASAQVIDLSQPDAGGSAYQWVGTRQNARAGTSLLRADMSGDVDRSDLVVGAPGAGALAQGQVFMYFEGPPQTGSVSLDRVDAIITGQAAGDRFGASTGAGMILAREVAPLPPRDLIAGAPSAFGGNGAVYLFGGPFPTGQTRSAANAQFKVIGAAGDQLGAAVLAIDLDGDGYRDIVMTAPGTGRIYVVFGGPALAGTRDLRTQSADFTMSTAPGALTLTAADLNNDGFKDLAVGVPAANSGAGVVYLVMGRTRGGLSGALALASGADGVMTGVAAGDAAGASIDTADFDGDGVLDLIVAAPGAGSRAGRAGAGEVYVLWGGSHFVPSRNLAAAEVTLRGAPNYRLGTILSHGNVRRAQQSDLLLLAPGASANGDVDVVYGASRSSLPATIDLNGGADRVLRGDPAGSPLRSLVSVQITGKNDDIVVAAPDGTAGGFSAAGVLYNVYSPALQPDPSTVAVSIAQGSTRAIPINVTNVGTMDVAWGVRSNTPWWAVSAAAGTSTASNPGQFILTVTTGNLAPGTYQGGYTLVSNSRHLAWVLTIPLQLTVTPGTPGSSAPTNPFGYPDPPDIGSPDGVPTPVGTNVTVIPASDFLVRFTNVVSPGRTWVTIQSASAAQAGVTDGRYGPWVYSVGTTARFSGPVTIAVAYQDFAPQSQPAIRLYGRNDLTAWTDLSKRIIWGSGASLPGNFVLLVPRPRVTSLVKNPSSATSAGSRVSFTATAEGSGGALAYRFWRYSASAGWQMVQDYSSNSTYSWSTSRGDAGDYSLSLWVRRADSTAQYDTWSGMPFTVGPPQPLTITDVAASEGLPAPSGRTLTWTAQSSGGLEPIRYQFWRYDQGRGWSMVQDYGASNSYTWATTPADEGGHVLQAWARSADSLARYDAYNGLSFSLTSPAPLRATGLTTDVTLPAPGGTAITFTAATSGGTGPLQYQFWRYHAGTGWTLAQNYGPSNRYTWSTGAGDVGTNVVQIWIRNASSTSQYDAYTGTAAFDITSPPSPRITSLTSNVPTPIEAGSWITWTAVATASAPGEYKFLRYDTAGGWKVAQDYSPSASYVWASAAEDQGTHALQVWARRVGSTAAYESWMGTGYFTLTGPPPPTVTSVTSDVPLPASQGTTITWTATVSAATAVQYQFWRYDAAGWLMVRDYSSSNTYTWTPSGADVGNHAISVWVRAVGSTAPYDAWRATGTFSINP